jgi:phage terminase large subunit-like protein
MAWQGGDLAFRQNSSAFLTAHRDGQRGAIVAEVLELRPKQGEPLQPSAVVAAGVEQAKRHGVHRMMCDAWYVDSVREHLQGTGVTLVAAPAGQPGKVAVYTAVRSMLHEGRIRIPFGHDRLMSQLRDTVAKPLSGGGIQIMQPRRGMAHGDVASAFVLAMYQAHGRGRMTINEASINFARRGWS